jgi:hypothetical protein
VKGRPLGKNSMIWIFSGGNSRFCSGVFSNREDAEKWIKKYKLSGVLTLYPVDEGVYDWAIRNEFFKPQKESEMKAEFIQKYSSASQEHYHYDNGESD